MKAINYLYGIGTVVLGLVFAFLFSGITFVIWFIPLSSWLLGGIMVVYGLTLFLGEELSGKEALETGARLVIAYVSLFWIFSL